jgi:hypothetical protein
MNNKPYCVYQAWGELECSNTNQSALRPTGFEGFTTTEERSAYSIYKYGDGIGNIVNLLEPTYIPPSPFVILFAEKPKIPHTDSNNNEYYPPYYGKWIVIPVGYHKTLGDWNNKTRTMYVPRGTTVHIYDDEFGTDLIATYTVEKSQTPKVVNMFYETRGVSSLRVEYAL